MRPATLAVLLLAAAACSTGSDEPSSAEPAPDTPPASADNTPEAGFPAGWTPARPEWGECARAAGPGMQCATLEVPLDWQAPDGAQIELELARRPASGDRIGSLLSNPGGPGGSGIEYLQWAPFSDAAAERFDLVSWDPRGVGESTPIECDDSVPAFEALDSSPDDEAERVALESAAATVAADCEAAEGEMLAHVHTADVARDLEAIRLALGGEPLNYLGFSYGTHIGQQYAELFGGNIRAMVLDGVVDPSQAFEEFLLGQTAAFDAVFSAQAAQCAAVGAGPCGVDDLAAAYDTLSTRVEQSPVVADGGSVGPSELATAALYTGYQTDGWSSLGPALGEALDGDASELRRLAESYRDLADYGPYAAVVCTDSQRPTDHATYREFEARAVDVSSRFGAAIANEMLPCATWGAEPQGEARALSAPDAAPILVVGNTGDPATPIENARAVAAALDSGQLLEVDMDGHTAYGSNRCASAAIDDYLIDLVLPPAGQGC